MDLATEIWKLVRDILLVLTGMFLVIAMALGLVPPNIAPTLVPLAFGLFALPGWLRSDERKQRNRRSRQANQNGHPSQGEKGTKDDSQDS